MVQPIDQPDFGPFIPLFFKAAFHEKDFVSLRRGTANRSSLDVPDRAERDQAVEWILGHRDTRTLYFGASSHIPLGLDGDVVFQDETHAGRNCVVLPRSMLFRVAFGPKEAGIDPAFVTIEDALANMLTCPLRPSIAWRTERAIEAVYLIKPPYGIEVCEKYGLFLDMQGRLPAEYHGGIRSSIWNMLGGDPTDRSATFLRVPLSRNKDGADMPQVSLLWYDFNQQYPYADLERLHPYGLTDILDREEEEAEPEWTPGPTDAINVPFDELPDDIKNMIKGKESPGKRLFRVVARMLRDGYSDECIQECVRHGGGFRWLDEGNEANLAHRVKVFIDQIRRGKAVYAPYLAPPIELSAVPEPVPLESCAPLSQDFSAMLDRYEAEGGITLAGRVREAARFYEHMFKTQNSGVLESPCGAGKSVWALCHAALHALAEDRYLYVTETVDGLYDAASVLERLTSTPVGRVHGFNPERCAALCGQRYTWRQCNPSDPRSVCHTCHQKRACAYFSRDEQRKRPILCMTHNGLIRALEEDASLLKDATLLVDENLSPFSNMRVSFSDLNRLAQYVSRSDLSRFFPCTGFAHQVELTRWEISSNARSFARRNYVLCRREETAALGDLCDLLRLALRSGQVGRVTTGATVDYERATDTLVKLLNFFRSTAHSDAQYAYREGSEAGEAYVLVKRSRFSFETGRSYRKLWMLDASATLAPDAYPDNLPVFTCPDLPDNSRLVTLHVVRCNPTRIRQATAIKLSTVPLCFGRRLRQHERVLVALDKDSTVGEDIKQMLRDAWNAGHLESEKGSEQVIVELQRGRIKGVNTAGDCTLALLTGMATFTGIDDCALHAAIQYGRSFPDTPHVYTKTGSPNWPGGKMQVPAMRTFYALRALDELYQAIWRTAVRNDRPVEAIVALADEYWLATLYRTVMPGMHVESAYKERAGIDTQIVDGQEREFSWQFEADDRMLGMRLIEMASGLEISKRQMAVELGYTGNRAWEKNKGVIMALMDPFFKEGSTVQKLKRKG